jgi:hypothetical protein
MDKTARVFLHLAGIAELVDVIAVLLGKEMPWFESTHSVSIHGKVRLCGAN